MSTRLQFRHGWPIGLVAFVICVCFGAGRAEAQQAPEGQAAKPAAAATQATPSNADFSDSLTGDWNGYRSWLHNHGVDIVSSYKEEIGGSVYGGVSPSGRSPANSTSGLRSTLRRRSALWAVSSRPR